MANIRSSSNPIQPTSSTKPRQIPSRLPQNRSHGVWGFLVGVDPILVVKAIVGHSGAKWELGLEFILVSSGLEGNRDWESFALSARESQTRTRGRVTTTTSSAWPAPRQPRNSRGTTQSRGTPIDAGESRGTGVNITSLVTACNNRTGRGGQFFPGAKKGGAINPPFKNCPKWNLHQPSLVFPHPLVFLVADELPLARPSCLALEHEVQELLRDSEELRGLGGCAEGGF